MPILYSPKCDYTYVEIYISIEIYIYVCRYEIDMTLYLSWENKYKEPRTVITEINLCKSYRIELARYLVNGQ